MTMDTMPAYDDSKYSSANEAAECQDAADAVDEAWEAMQEAFHHAKRVLRLADSPEYDRLDAYVSQVFDRGSRFLGMQSLDSWMQELTAALRDPHTLDPDTDEDDDWADSCRCGMYPAGQHGC